MICRLDKITPNWFWGVKVKAIGLCNKTVSGWYFNLLISKKHNLKNLTLSRELKTTVIFFSTCKYIWCIIWEGNERFDTQFWSAEMLFCKWKFLLIHALDKFQLEHCMKAKFIRVSGCVWTYFSILRTAGADALFGIIMI